MKPINIILIGISLFFLVLYGIEFAAVMTKGNYISTAMLFIAIVLIAIAIAMLILIR